MTDLGWTAHDRMNEEQNARACWEAAQRAGYTEDQAEMCDNGSLKCLACPWRKEQEAEE